jgi:UDP-glucose 4-epimerase
MDERHPIRPETPYAASKVAQDMVVYSYGCTYGLPWTTFRPFNMYGPNSHWQGFRGELIPKMIVRAMNRLPLAIFGDGHQTRDFVFVEEAARALMAVFDNPDSLFKPINFCFGTEVSIRRIAETICRHFQLDPTEFIRNKASRPGDVRRHLGDNSQFRELFGFVPRIDIEEGLRLTIDWFKSLPFKPEELLSEEVERNWE